VRVLFVNPGRAVGGAEASLLLLIEGVRSHGIDPAVALFGDGPFRDRLASLGVATTCVVPSRRVMTAGRYRSPGALAALPLIVAGLPTALRLAAVARRVGADLIHTNGMKAHLLGGLASRVGRVPGIWHLRDFPPAGWAGRMVCQAARRLPSMVLAVSEAVARAVRSQDGAAPRVVTVHDPIDTRRFHPGAGGERVRQELGLGPGIPVVGLIAHLTPWKGHERFLDIARAVLNAVGETRFVVVGGAVYETAGHAGYARALARRAAALGLADRVTFLGARQDIPEVLAALDVLVHCPTAPEPFGRVLAEAMAVGRPVVAARSGGIPEIVDEGLTGVLMTPDDVGAYASAVIRLLADRRLRGRLGDAGRRQVEKRFSVDTHVTAVLEAYHTLLGPARPTATATAAA
jgi:glycosyltransferase involved in cell wall biosynthesis